MNYLNDFFIRLNHIIRNDPRFREESYLFVMAALGRVIRGLEKPRHVQGSELLEAIREEAEGQFGPMAIAVFHHWGIKNSLDFGAIVFNMVREGLLSKADSDQLEDFKDSVFFENLFDQNSGYQLNREEGVLNAPMNYQPFTEL